MSCCSALPPTSSISPVPKFFPRARQRWQLEAQLIFSTFSHAITTKKASPRNVCQIVWLSEASPSPWGMGWGRQGAPGAGGDLRGPRATQTLGEPAQPGIKAGSPAHLKGKLSTLSSLLSQAVVCCVGFFQLRQRTRVPVLFKDAFNSSPPRSLPGTTWIRYFHAYGVRVGKAEGNVQLLEGNI